MLLSLQRIDLIQWQIHTVQQRMLFICRSPASPAAEIRDYIEELKVEKENYHSEMLS